MQPVALEPKLKTLPKKWRLLLVHFLSAFKNDTVDFRRPHLRSSVREAFPLFVAMYVVLGACGAAASVALVRGVLRRSKAAWRQEPAVHWLAFNLGVSGVVQSLLVLPATLAVLLVQNWVFGPVLCYTLPMLQDGLLHVSMLSLVMLAADRHRRVMHPTRLPLSGVFCATVVWVVSLVAVLPYPVYTDYLDLGTLVKEQFTGTGICAMNQDGELREYLRLFFHVMYILPVTVAALLHVQTWRKLKSLENVAEDCTPRRHRGCDNATSQQHVVDVAAERRAQRFLVAMTTSMAVFCLLPHTVMRIVRLLVPETSENTGTFIVIFLLLVWLGFIPTCTTPVIFTLWHRQVEREGKEMRPPPYKCVVHHQNRAVTPPCYHPEFTTV